tara:strand:+ start:563 stop:1033 length:471 start_codon:yes stop_codon:yes gene_type:complete
MVDNLQQFIDDVAVEVYGMTRTEALQEKKCVACNHKVKMFSNKISADEYNISALCETCQTETFDSASIDETVKNYAHLYNWGVKDSLWSKIAVVEDKVDGHMFYFIEHSKGVKTPVRLLSFETKELALETLTNIVKNHERFFPCQFHEIKGTNNES